MSIEEIKSRLTIAEVLQHYHLKLDKNNMLLCPFHEDKTASLQVSFERNNNKCHACDKNKQTYFKTGQNYYPKSFNFFFNTFSSSCSVSSLTSISSCFKSPFFSISFFALLLITSNNKFSFLLNF
jgi:hypothetical protein